MTRASFAAALAMAFAAGLAFGQVGTTDSSSGVKPKASTSKSTKPLKYAVPSERQIAIAQQTMAALAEKAQDIPDLKKGMHKIDSPHFTIYSWLPAGQDNSIRQSMEQLYGMLCKAFSVDKDETVWVGKCGVFMLDTPERFETFITTVDDMDPSFAVAGGYCRYCPNFAYLVLNMPGRSGDVEGYKLTLTHECTHGFLSRFISDRNIPIWLNEGIADAMADSLVPSKRLKIRLKGATKEAIKEGRNVMSVFESVKLDQFDYGIAQSWVQFLLARDRNGFLRFLTLIKQGKTEAEAMKECYKWTREDMVNNWRSAAARSIR